MCNQIKRAGWTGTAAFWLGVLFVLPNCGFTGLPGTPPPNLDRGPLPHSDPVFCDIEKALTRHCATERDKATGIRLSEAAVALAEGRTTAVGLDDSPEARARCGGEPEAVLFEGPFPQGLPVCLNCEDAPAATTKQICERRCFDLFGTFDPQGNFIPDNPPAPSVSQFCVARAHPSVNHTLVLCGLAGCSNEGIFNDEYPDLRRLPRFVEWTDLIGVSVDPGGDLVRTAPPTDNFDTGAVSRQWITKGDAYFDFALTRNVRVGLAEVPAACPPPCADTDPGLATIDFAIEGGADGLLYIFVRQTKVDGPDINDSFGPYASGDRFRIALESNGGGAAVVRFRRVLQACSPGYPCDTTLLHTDSSPAVYPLRVDVSLQETGSAVRNARLVYILEETPQ